MRPDHPVHTESPLFDYMTVLRNLHPSGKYWLRIVVYSIKFAFLEPFRLIEKLVYGKRLEAFQLARDPVFILGYYRSGTTHLQEVLLQDPQFGYLNFYQCYFPSGHLVSERICKRPFQLFLDVLGFLHPAHGVPFKFELPAEEDVAMVASGFRNACSWGQLFPRSFKDYFNRFVFRDGISPEDEALFEHEYRMLVKRTAFAQGNKLLLLKSPPHTGRLALLRELYPKAKFVYIYRNPYLVYKSNQKLWRSFNGQCLQEFDTETAKEAILWSFDKSLDRYETEKQGIPPDQLFEIRYEDFLESPEAHLERLYRQLGLSGYEAAKPRFKAYLGLKHGSNIDRYRYEEADFEAVESRWKRWLGLYGYSRPNGSA